MRSMIRLGVVFCAGVVMFLGHARGFDEKPKGGTWKVTGKVVDQKGTPVGGVKLTAAQIARLGKRFGTTAKEDGTFEFQIPEEIVSVTVEARDEKGGRRGYELTLNYESVRKTPFQVVLKPVREVTIEVVDGEGKPIEGASVLAKQSYYPVLDAKTGADGIVRGSFADEVEGTSVAALKSKVGYDYFSANLKDRVNGEKIEALPERVRLKLEGARSIRFRVTDSSQKPVAGVPVALDQINRRSNKAFPIISTINPATTTDQEGMVEFDWVPLDIDGAVTVRCLSEEFARESLSRVMLVPGQMEYPFLLQRSVALRGRVKTAEGEPAGDVSLILQGMNLTGRGIHRELKTDGAGRFQAEVPGNAVYQIFAKKGDLIAQKTGVSVTEGKPVEEVELTLVPGTVVRGRLTQGTEKRGVKRVLVRAIQQQAALPNAAAGAGRPARGRMTPAPRMEGATTDEDGNFRFVLGTGDWSLRNDVDFSESQPISIKDQKEIVQDLHVEWDEVPFAGRVVDPEGKPVSGATLRLYYPLPRGGLRPTELKTDKAGTFQGVRRVMPLQVYIASPDKKLAIVVDLEKAKEPFQFQLQGLTTLRGKLVDDEGNAKGGVELRCRGFLFWGAKYNMGPPELLGRTVTNKDGSFAITGLSTGAEWQIVWEEEQGRSKYLKQVSVIEPGELDVGEVVLKEK